MNTGYFLGRLSDMPLMRHGKSSKGYVYFKLIINEKNKSFSCDFTAFGYNADFLVKNCRTGDALLCTYHLSSDVIINEQNEKTYKTSLIVDKLEFAGMGKLTREHLAANGQDIYEDISSSDDNLGTENKANDYDPMNRSREEIL